MKHFIIMGMHSSATSLIAEGLSKAGVKMWLSRSNHNWEDVEIMKRNEWLINQLGGTWKNLPDLKDWYVDNYDECLDAVRQAYSERNAQKRMWGMKDPRFAITWLLWSEVIDFSQAHFIFIDRDTDETVKSCRRRWGRHKDWRGLVTEYKHRMTEIKQEIEQ